MLFCHDDTCKYCNEPYCQLDNVTLSEDHECESYRFYFDEEEYHSEFYRCIGEDGKCFKKKDRGRRIEIDGLVLFYQDKELNDNTYVIEESTGRLATYGEFRKLDMTEVIKANIEADGYVKDLPDWKKEK